MIIDDAALVNMALDGKHEAFDELVRKHRSRVLSVARTLVGTRDGAEDVAQQAFVVAFANLHLLKDPVKFRPWLMTITRRCSSRQWMVQSRESTGFCEVVMASHCYQPIDDLEVRARIAEMLAELSDFNRGIVVMHYLYGCSCKEIGESLGMPQGTIKRMLHESRNSLRASSELMRSGGEMSQKKQGPRRMEWWINGEWPDGIMDSVLRQSICLTINKTGLTSEQIAKRVDANEAYVREALQVLEAEELVEKAGRGRYRNAFVALGAEDWIELSREIRSRSERVGDLFADALPELQAAWENSPKPAQGFDWNTCIWPTLALMVCNMGLFRKGLSATGPKPPVHPASGRCYWAGGREEVAPEHKLWITGFSFISRSTGFSYGYFWSSYLPFERRLVDCADELRLLFGAVASGFRDIDSIAKAADLDIERARDIAANMIEIGLLKHAQDGLALTFPVFTNEDESAILPTVDRVSKRLAGEVDSVASIVDEKFHELGFGHLEQQFGMWRGWLSGNAAAEGLRVLYDRGILPHPGDPAPANFCMVGWFDQTKLFSYEK